MTISVIAFAKILDTLLLLCRGIISRQILFPWCYYKNSKLNVRFVSLLTRFNYILQYRVLFSPTRSQYGIFHFIIYPCRSNSKFLGNFLDILSDPTWQVFFNNVEYITIRGHFRLSDEVGDEFVRDSRR